MEDVLVGVGQAAFDAQIAVGIGALALHREGMPVVLLHSDAAVKQVAVVLRIRNGVEFNVDIAE